MTKEYIGEAFRAPYCEAMTAWYAGGMVGGKPVIEFFNRHCSQTGGRWDEFLSQDGEPAFEVNWDYRFKPAPKRTVTMYTKDGPVELVAPELEAPKVCSLYFRLTGLALDDGYTWSSDSSDKAALRRGLVFLTREDAQAMADFQRKQRLGKV